MDRTYIDSQSSSFYNDMLKKCMGKGHKTPKYLFNQRRGNFGCWYQSLVPK